MPIAPRTFHAWAVRAPSKRALWDATITEVLAGYYEPDEHGADRLDTPPQTIRAVAAALMIGDEPTD